MSKSIEKSAKYQFMNISTAEAFYRVFCALPKNDQLEVVRYILEDEKIQHNLEIPNKTTLKSFAENKSKMQVFHTIDELHKDLLM